MDRTILISGGNSDIGLSIIQKLNHRNNLKIISTRCGGRSVKEYVDEEYTVDYRDADYSVIESISHNNTVTDLIILNGLYKTQDTLNTFNNHKDIVDVNLYSAIYISDILLPLMAKNKFGRIIFTGTASANHGGGKTSFTYGLTKSGLIYLTRHLAKYYSERHILINMISPGFVNTKLHSKTKTKQEIIDREKHIPLRRKAEVDEIAGAYIFLLFDNLYIHGENIIVDGGDFI